MKNWESRGGRSLKVVTCQYRIGLLDSNGGLRWGLQTGAASFRRWPRCIQDKGGFWVVSSRCNEGPISNLFLVGSNTGFTGKGSKEPVSMFANVSRCLGLFCSTAELVKTEPGPLARPGLARLWAEADGIREKHL